MVTIGDYIKRVDKQGKVLTKFLDSAENSELLKSYSRNYHIVLDGGFTEAERKRALISNLNELADCDDFEITIIELIFDNMAFPVTHRHILGTILALGIKRETIGDIVINNGRFFVFTINEMASFISNNLTMINHLNVKTKIIALEDFVYQETSTTKNINVASLRLDAVIARALNVSRNKALEIINKGLVQINHIECLNPSYFLKIEDLISIRHFGRIMILEIINTTKKDRLNIKIGIKH